MSFDWSLVRRWPDAEAPNLFASDAADRLIIDTAAPWLATTMPAEIAVIGDTYGGLTLAAASVVAESASDLNSNLPPMRRKCDVEGSGAAFSALSSDERRGIRVHQDSAIGERALAANAERTRSANVEATGAQAAAAGGPVYRSLPLGSALVTGVRLVLLRLPKSLDALDEIAATVAAGAAHRYVGRTRSRAPGQARDGGCDREPGRASEELVVVAGGMQKHLSVTMNEVLGRYFERVDVGHGRQKARVLVVRWPQREAAAAALEAWPRREWHDEIVSERTEEGRTGAGQVGAGQTGAGQVSAGRAAVGQVSAGRTGTGLWVCAHGGAFAGTRVDIGTRLLLRHLHEAAPDARTAVDLACGTGVLATALALSRPELQVTATDVSAAAAASARATAEANGVADRVRVRQESAGEGLAAGSADLVVLNPPFHTGAALDLRVGRMLVAAAARLLAPGGELWTVYNSHLDYRPVLRGAVGPTRQVDRDAKFTVTASVRQ